MVTKKQSTNLTSKSLSIILMLLTIFSLCASAVIAYTVNNETIKHNSEDIENLKLTCKETLDQVNQNTINVAVLKTIAADVKDIKQDIKVINSKIN